VRKILSLAITLVLLALASAWLWRARAALPYNEAGRFYDSAKAVVYKESAVFAYGLLALIFTATAVTSLLVTIRMWRR
jgi:hypothetical protein